MAGFVIGVLFGFAAVRVTYALTGSLFAASAVGGVLFVAAWLYETRTDRQP